MSDNDVDDWAEWEREVRLDTRPSQPRPFLAPAIDAARVEFEQRLRDTIGRLLRGDG